MKTSALLSLLLLFACASGDGFIDQRVIDCEPGQIVTIEAGLNTTSIAPRGTENVDDQQMLIVLVGNNSHEDITVKSIRVEQNLNERSFYRLDSGAVVPNETIAEGDEGEFKIRLYGRRVSPASMDTEQTAAVVLDVKVELSNGDLYRCGFRIPLS